MCDTEELKNTLSDSETPQQHALSELLWNPVFRQKLLVITLATLIVLLALHVTGLSIIIWAQILIDFSLTVKVAPHECVMKTSQPQA